MQDGAGQKGRRRRTAHNRAIDWKNLSLVLGRSLLVDETGGFVEDQHDRVLLVEVEHVVDRTGGGVEGAAAETFAIGDGLNDISMLKAAGVSVAMAGAPPSVREAAQFVTTSNDEEGFARALALHVLPRIVQ